MVNEWLEFMKLRKFWKKELLEKIKNAPEKPRLTKKIYDAILIEPLDKDSCDSGYRDLNVYGATKDLNGLIIEKIETDDNVKINSLFKKLKKFDLTIDIPYSTSIIHIYFKNHQIEVENREFRFIKEKIIKKKKRRS